MSVTVKVNDVKETINRILSDDVKYYANTTLFKLIEPYTPKREGNLIKNRDITKDGIHYKSLYAKRMYYGEDFNFNKEKNPLATAKWDEVSMISNKKKLVKDIEEYIKRR